MAAYVPIRTPVVSPQLSGPLGRHGLVGNSPALLQMIREIETVASTPTTVLLTGETGTGKEVAARAIHELSHRRERPFIKVNCAAIPATLLESELFGHERGAFTGAVTLKQGRFELAHSGTILLDEIGDLPLELQPKLLRVLQEQEFERLGSTRTLKADVRIIAATHCNLEALVAEGLFRADLFYRLAVFPVRLPALRDRVRDIPLLAWHFVQSHAQRLGRSIQSIPDATMQALVDYPWPGNIRELQNFLERAVILSTGSTLEAPLSQLRVEPGVHGAQARTLRDAERNHILATLEKTGGVIGGSAGAAARLGVPRTTLIYKMRRLGIGRQEPALV